jgi:hypothetical protein
MYYNYNKISKIKINNLSHKINKSNLTSTAIFNFKRTKAPKEINQSKKTSKEAERNYNNSTLKNTQEKKPPKKPNNPYHQLNPTPISQVLHSD